MFNGKDDFNIPQNEYEFLAPDCFEIERKSGAWEKTAVIEMTSILALSIVSIILEAWILIREK